MYDRQEIHEILLHLLSHGYVGRKRANDMADMFPADSPADNEEEKTTFLFIGEKHWFTV